jgi:hypothetical protein
MSQIQNKLTTSFIVLLCIFNVHSQKVINIYKNDSLSSFFIKEGYYNGVFNYSAQLLKDSLPDGKYYFYDVDRKDSLSLEKKIIIRAEYKNGKKNGIFENHTYFENSKKKCLQYVSTWSCKYVQGLKDGIEESYVYYLSTKIYAPEFYYEYLMGKKNGLCILYYNAAPYKLSIYDNDILISEYVIPLKE